jgi:hypothetical protein
LNPKTVDESPWILNGIFFFLQKRFKPPKN